VLQQQYVHTVQQQQHAIHINTNTNTYIAAKEHFIGDGQENDNATAIETTTGSLPAAVSQEQG
jgi:hypothetical protein